VVSSKRKSPLTNVENPVIRVPDRHDPKVDGPGVRKNSHRLDYDPRVATARCFGCGAVVPAQVLAIHAYMLAAPGCWQLYCSLQDWKMSLPPDEAPTSVQQLVDGYATQHATNPERRNRQSVALHLMSLCAGIERGVPGGQLRRLIGSWTHRQYPILVPRPESFDLTVVDVVAAATTSRSAIVEEWATSTWANWSAHHAQIRSWVTDAMERSF
jgi:hypothetical protein